MAIAALHLHSGMSAASLSISSMGPPARSFPVSLTFYCQKISACPLALRAANTPSMSSDHDFNPTRHISTSVISVIHCRRSIVSSLNCNIGVPQFSIIQSAPVSGFLLEKPYFFPLNHSPLQENHWNLVGAMHSGTCRIADSTPRAISRPFVLLEAIAQLGAGTR